MAPFFMIPGTSPAPGLAIGLLLGFAGLSGVAHWLGRIGHLVVASWSLIVIYMVLSLSSLVAFGGLDGPVVAAFVLTPLMAGVLRGAGAARVMTVVTIVITGALLLLTLSESLPESIYEANPFGSAATAIACVAIAGILLSTSLGQLNAAVSDAQGHARSAERAAELERELHDARRLEAIGRLAGGVAHDFNNLLTVIRTNTALLRMNTDSSSHEMLDEVGTAASRAADLTGQLLAFARRQALAPRVLDLVQVVRELEPLMRRLTREDVRLEVRHEADLWHVRADPTQLQQVLINLVMNANDALEGGGSILIDMGNGAALPPTAEAPTGQFVRLSVSDTGAGIDAETLDRIFEPFFSSKGERGTGLGLATVHGIVTQSGGYIHVDSTVGAGTRFDVFLPMGLPGVETQAARRKRRGEVPRAKILVVDDDEGVRRTVCRSLAAAGHEVLEASGRESALELLADDVRVLVTDVVMPEVSGPALVEEIRARHPGVRVLFMSGYATEALGESGRLRLDEEFIPKPFTGEELTERVDELLADVSGY